VAQRHEAIVAVHVLRAQVLVLLDEARLAGADDQPLHARLKTAQVPGLPQRRLHQGVGPGNDHQPRHLASDAAGHPVGDVEKLLDLQPCAVGVVDDAHRADRRARGLVLAEEDRGPSRRVDAVGKGHRLSKRGCMSPVALRAEGAHLGEVVLGLDFPDREAQ
jgi:hypothetical protein